MDQVIEHAAGDLVVRVQAGARMGQVAEVLARAGQRISLDVPASATVGGVIADGLAGPLRLRFGTPRDLLIGVTVARADGVIAHSGGKVVKNVAGYDLGKLFAGSRGTLGVIVDATFRLHPIPATSEWITTTLPTPPTPPAASTPPTPPAASTPPTPPAPPMSDISEMSGDHAPGAKGSDATSTAVDGKRCHIASLGTVVAGAANSSLLASAVEVWRAEPGAPVEIGVLIEGTSAGVESRAEGMAELLGDGVRRQVWRDEQRPTVRVSCWVSELDTALAAIDGAAGEADIRPAVGGSAGAGVLDVWFDGDPGPFVSLLRRRLAGSRGSVTVLAPWDGDVLGDLPGLGLMRAVKDQFDPGHTMAPGRMAEGLLCRRICERSPRTVCTAGSVCPPARRTSCGARRWTPRVAGSTCSPRCSTGRL
jgi:glycolate oxidase FAD binding subunit